MANIDLVLPSYAQHGRIAAALEAIALNGSSESMDTLDVACKALLDGTNTTSVFWDYYARAKGTGEADKYTILARFATCAAQAWNHKTYTLRSYMAKVSTETEMTPLDDLAGKPKAQLCTDTTVPEADWADEDPMTWYIRANALSKADGTMDIKFFEGEDGFDITGDLAPVYSFALSLWIKEWDDGTYNYISFRTTQAAGFYPDAADVAPDNTRRPITWHPSFPGGLNSAGGLTSGAGLKAYNFKSALDGIAAARKVTKYEGLWNDCDSRWVLRMWQLRHFNLENGGIAEGCTTYNYQYVVATTESNVKRVLITTAQAANLVVGSTVSVGDSTSNTNHDRGQATMRNLVDLVRIASIETVRVNEVEYAAVNLETDTTFTTTAQTYISTMPWHSGATEALPGHKDGCPGHLTNGKYPLRVAGVEILSGAYSVGLDPLYTVVANTTGVFDYTVVSECRDSEKLDGTVTADYKATGISMVGVKQGWNYVKSFVRTRLGILFPAEFGGSSNTYMKSAFYGSAGAGVRCPWRFGFLVETGSAGVACEAGHSAPTTLSWYGQPRLGGAGKKRGEWPA